jgi:hypothetical protein
VIFEILILNPFEKEEPNLDGHKKKKVINQSADVQFEPRGNKEKDEKEFFPEPGTKTDRLDPEYLS